jgi:hypothetical protein
MTLEVQALSVRVHQPPQVLECPTPQQGCEEEGKEDDEGDKLEVLGFPISYERPQCHLR